MKRIEAEAGIRICPECGNDETVKGEDLCLDCLISDYPREVVPNES